ncbi:hypothetical protein NNO07_21485 [Pseudomonas resinovorans]|uniref:Uncharacterized protein n=1 Tax=Metapseudomonas resinovorans TaxID=53412 RepID=A0ABT4YAF2_METRE|nr:hypothetical protein [Pseudomonas resinovorans]MDA8485649.1 hypothetical protein [Pseudomonas resinovorans]
MNSVKDVRPAMLGLAGNTRVVTSLLLLIYGLAFSDGQGCPSLSVLAGVSADIFVSLSSI